MSSATKAPPTIEEIFKRFDKRILSQLANYREVASKDPKGAPFIKARAGGMILSRNILKSIVSEETNGNHH